MQVLRRSATLGFLHRARLSLRARSPTPESQHEQPSAGLPRGGGSSQGAFFTFLQGLWLLILKYLTVIFITITSSTSPHHSHLHLHHHHHQQQHRHISGERHLHHDEAFITVAFTITIAHILLIDAIVVVSTSVANIIRLFLRWIEMDL